MNEDDIRHATAKARQTFLEEADDLIASMESALLALESTPEDAELINSLFRAAHTIKGSGGMFGLSALVGFTHRVESVLDHLRSGQRVLDLPTISLLLKCTDQIADLLRFAKEYPDDVVAEELVAQSDVLANQLEAMDTARNPIAPLIGAGVDDAGRDAAVASDVPSVWHISLRFAPETFCHGIDPFATLRYLGTLGVVEMVETIDTTLPVLSQIDPERCYIGFEIRLLTRVAQSVLEDAFEFIQDECIIHLIPHGKRLKDYIQLIDDLPEDADRVGEILVACGALTRRQLHEALARQHDAAARDDVHVPIGEILQKQAGVSPHLVDAAIKKQDQNRTRKTDSAFFRVQSEKVDTLIDMVGELVVLSSAAQTQSVGNANADLMETIDYLKTLVDGLRSNAMSLRMVAIGESFEKFRRVVRDTSANLGKSIRLEIVGGETELDKVVIEKITDPLMHLVRNAMDHGLESPAERENADKPSEGVLTLSAHHASGSIVIRVSDDGRGIDPERILAKARERGIVKDGVSLSREQILKLIFEPGFSTAEKVSDISGRGVGMDVVRRNIDALRGSVDVDAAIGAGTTITITLPLTLAIIEGFLVRCGNNHFVLPMTHVEECIDLGEAAVAGRSGVIMHRGEPLPVLNVSDVLGMPASAVARKSAVIVRTSNGSAGLQVDRLLGEQQTVIKPLGPLFSNLDFVAGSSVLGSGEIALILDVPALLDEMSAPTKMKAA